jgi:hypothetical protein
MGRPINKKHFGNTNDGGLGGEGVASVTVTGAGTGYTTGEAVTFSAPQLPGGVTTTGTIVDNGSGGVLSVTITVAGTGYTSAPTATFATGGANATGTAVVTATKVNAISLTAFVTGGSNLTGDVVAQKGAKRFKVTTATGTEVCKLVTATPAAGGEMRITAVDSAAGTYFLSKISARTCTVVRGTGTEFAEGAKVKWTKGSAVLNDSVSINNA